MEGNDTKAIRPRIIFGTMTIAPPGRAGSRIDTVEGAREILQVYKSRGYSELDTARMYGDSYTEEYLAKAGWRESGFSIATKVLPPYSPGRLRREFEGSLHNLGTDSVDIFYLHAPDWNTPFEDTLAQVDELYREGKFRKLGLSNYTAFQVAEICVLCRERGWVRPTIYQGMYNAITRSNEPELIPCLHKFGLELVVYNPLAGGFFSGKWKPQGGELPRGGGRFAGDATQAKNYRARYFRDAYFNAVELIGHKAREHGLTMVEIALRWLVHHSKLRLGKDGIIVGASSCRQLEENMDALEKGPLPDEIIQVLDQAWLSVKSDTPNYWFGEASAPYQV